MDSNVLHEIRNYANAAHGQQTRRYSQDPYIVHPERVLMNCRRFMNSPPVLAAALLHDVLEDTAVTKRELIAFLNSVMDESTAALTFQIVEELTDVFIKKDHPNFNRRKRKILEAERLSKVSPEAQTIKYADIIDNLDVAAHEPDFAIVYLNEALELLRVMTRGNADLRSEALHHVQGCLKELKRGKVSEKA
jgi:guanosine-3',5'-bis(diphosphate) 3'-pyrophosphohydrolase